MKYEVMQGSEIVYLNIRGSKKLLPFKYRYEVPEKVLKNYGYLRDDADDHYLKYKDVWMHTSEFQIAPKIFQELGFDGIMPQTVSSGYAIRITANGEKYRIAWFWYSRN
jgi:hypothetical protein